MDKTFLYWTHDDNRHAIATHLTNRLYRIGAVLPGDAPCASRHPFQTTFN